MDETNFRMTQVSKLLGPSLLSTLMEIAGEEETTIVARPVWMFSHR